MPTPNLALTERVFAYIQAHPETWEQRVWAAKTECGTACCFAGHAVALAHPDAAFDLPDDDEDDPTAYAVTLSGEKDSRPIRSAAVDALGLNEGEAENLFYEKNDLLDLAVAIENIAYAHGLAVPDSIAAYVLAHAPEADDA